MNYRNIFHLMLAAVFVATGIINIVLPMEHGGIAFALGIFYGATALYAVQSAHLTYRTRKLLQKMEADFKEMA